MPNNPATKPTITSLIRKIKDEIMTGKQKIEKTILNEKTITYWNIGKHIYEHLLFYKDRADYGDSLFKTLAEELNIGGSILYRTVQFYEIYPENFATWRNLTWSHYRILLTIKDNGIRKEYEKRVIEEELSVRELKELIKKEKNDIEGRKNLNLTEKRGLLHIYKLKTIENNSNMQLYVDLGFKFYIDKLPEGNSVFSEGNIVKVKETKSDCRFTPINEDLAGKLYTYKGFVKEIIDGDTLWVNLELGLNTWTTKKVRLRGINSPPIETPPGQKVKKFITLQLSQCEFIIVKTYWRDKYNRYLADIFYAKNEIDANVVAETGIFLNQLLLDKGFVRKYSL